MARSKVFYSIPIPTAFPAHDPAPYCPPLPNPIPEIVTICGTQMVLVTRRDMPPDEIWLDTARGRVRITNLKVENTNG
jgi:hypothetical protein